MWKKSLNNLPKFEMGSSNIKYNLKDWLISACPVEQGEFISLLWWKCLVYRIVIDIVIQKLSKSKNIVLLLDGFHMAMAVRCCFGKLIKGSGREDALVENNTWN